MLCFVFFVIGLVVGALLIITAEDKCDNEALDIVYEAGCEKGRADEQKKVMRKLEEYRSKTS